MKSRIVAIGNSRGIRIPKPLLEQTGLSGEVEIRAENGALTIRPAKKPRAGWAAAFREMARRGDDALLDNAAPSLSTWDESEWEWRMIFHSRLSPKSRGFPKHDLCTSSPNPSVSRCGLIFSGCGSNVQRAI